MTDIESLDWQDFLLRCDRSGKLFHLDPPYYGGDDDYGAGIFTRSDFPIMARRLARSKAASCCR